jgi:hypothetical protein
MTLDKASEHDMNISRFTLTPRKGDVKVKSHENVDLSLWL